MHHISKYATLLKFSYIWKMKMILLLFCPNNYEVLIKIHFQSVKTWVKSQTETEVGVKLHRHLYILELYLTALKTCSEVGVIFRFILVK
jgi:hypothetical protein